jgi:hypothetical protein
MVRRKENDGKWESAREFIERKMEGAGRRELRSGSRVTRCNSSARPILFVSTVSTIFYMKSFGGCHADSYTAH